MERETDDASGPTTFTLLLCLYSSSSAFGVSWILDTADHCSQVFHFLAEIGLNTCITFPTRAFCTLICLARLLPVRTSAITLGRTVTYANRL